jgi:hypothetical protein
VGCGELPELVETAPAAPPLARFGKSGRSASKQRVGVRIPSGERLSTSFSFSCRPPLRAPRPQEAKCHENVRLNFFVFFVVSLRVFFSGKDLIKTRMRKGRILGEVIEGRVKDRAAHLQVFTLHRDPGQSRRERVHGE